MDELKELLAKANENYLKVKSQVEDGETKLAEQAESQKALVEKLEGLVDTVVSKDELENLKNEIADLELKVQKPTLNNQNVDQKQFKAALVAGVATFVKNAKEIKEDFTTFVSHNVKEQLGMEVKAALNLTNTGEGLESVDQVLSREIIERAREAYPIIGEVRIRNMPRSLREEVLISFPSVQLGIENVAGSAISETDVQRYAEVVNNIAKVNAKPRITDEAMYGSDLDLYEHLLSLLADELGRWLALQILFGDNTGKAMRGILSTNRVDITNTTGESFKDTFGAGQRDADFYPVIPTGVSASFGATDKAVVDFLIDMETSLPTQYLNGAKWYMNRRTLALFKKLRDANDQPVFSNGYKGEPMTILGYPVVIEDYMPDVAANATPLIFGQLSQAFSMSPGDIDKMLIDPYTVDGCTVVKVDKEYFEIVGKNDAIIVAATTTNAGA